MSLFACIGAATLLFIHDVLTDRNPVDMIAEVLGITVSLFFFWVSSDKRKPYLSFLFLMFVLGLLDWTWYASQGMGIGHSLYYLAILVIGIIIVDDSLKIHFHVIFTLNMVVILTVEFVNPDFYYIGVQNRMEPVLSKTVFLTITYLVIGAVVTFLKKQYDVTYVLNKRQNEILERKNKEIDEKNKVIEAQNLNLEKLVDQRTQQIQLQKEQLLKYAFFNSHKVRAPLSNMLGIIELLEHANLEESELQRLLTMLNDQAHRLDQEIQFVQDIIHQTPHEHDYQEFTFSKYEEMLK